MASANDKSAGESDAAINSILTPREQKMILFGLLSCEELPTVSFACLPTYISYPLSS